MLDSQEEKFPASPELEKLSHSMTTAQVS